MLFEPLYEWIRFFMNDERFLLPPTFTSCLFVYIVKYLLVFILWMWPVPLLKRILNFKPFMVAAHITLTCYFPDSGLVSVFASFVGIELFLANTWYLVYIVTLLGCIPFVPYKHRIRIKWFGGLLWGYFTLTYSWRDFICSAVGLSLMIFGASELHNSPAFRRFQFSEDTIKREIGGESCTFDPFNEFVQKQWVTEVGTHARACNTTRDALVRQWWDDMVLGTETATWQQVQHWAVSVWPTLERQRSQAVAASGTSTSEVFGNIFSDLATYWAGGTETGRLDALRATIAAGPATATASTQVGDEAVDPQQSTSTSTVQPNAQHVPQLHAPVTSVSAAPQLYQNPITPDGVVPVMDVE
eukprot:TRINITY_DN67330_c8_g9_i1.p1 TRINITY_DN67330_c8_g9~~TRINITY_DN67330_c8_g9_i1.p1  ORF type:complete len:376 (+),score=19.93 TRINITY_DN67330_c8_g9_i1:60-1130(+)